MDALHCDLAGRQVLILGLVLGLADVASAARDSPVGPAAPCSSTRMTEFLLSGICFAAMESSWRKLLVFWGSYPPMILSGFASIIVFSCTPTNRIIFSKNDSFCAFSVTFAESVSSGVYRVEAKPLTFINSRTISKRNRNGGFDSSFSDSLGLVIISPNII